MESADDGRPVLDAFGKPVEYSRSCLRRHVTLSEAGTPYKSRPQQTDRNTLASKVWNGVKSSLRHVDGTLEAMRSAASVFGPSAKAKGGKRLEEIPTYARLFDEDGLHHGAAAAALGAIDPDESMAEEFGGESGAQEALASQHGRPVGATMMYLSQVGLVQFTSFVLDLMVLAALFVLRPSQAPIFGVTDEDRLSPQPTRPPPEHIVKFLGWDTPGGLPTDLVLSLGGGVGTYERFYFSVAAAALLLAILLSMVTAICSPGFYSLSRGDKALFLFLAPVSLHTWYIGYLSAIALKAANDQVRDTARCTAHARPQH